MWGVFLTLTSSGHPIAFTLLSLKRRIITELTRGRARAWSGNFFATENTFFKRWSEGSSRNRLVFEMSAPQCNVMEAREFPLSRTSVLRVSTSPLVLPIDFELKVLYSKQLPFLFLFYVFVKKSALIFKAMELVRRVMVKGLWYRFRNQS